MLSIEEGSELWILRLLFGEPASNELGDGCSNSSDIVAVPSSLIPIVRRVGEPKMVLMIRSVEDTTAEGKVYGDIGGFWDRKSAT